MSKRSPRPMGRARALVAALAVAALAVGWLLTGFADRPAKQPAESAPVSLNGEVLGSPCASPGGACAPPNPLPATEQPPPAASSLASHPVEPQPVEGPGQGETGSGSVQPAGRLAGAQPAGPAGAEAEQPPAGPNAGAAGSPAGEPQQLQGEVDQLQADAAAEAQRVAALEEEQSAEEARRQEAEADPGVRSAWLDEARARIQAAAEASAAGSTEGVSESLASASDLLAAAAERAASHGSAREADLARAAASSLQAASEALSRSDLFQAREGMAPALRLASQALESARTLAQGAAEAPPPAGSAGQTPGY